MGNVRRVTDSVRIRVTFLATVLVAVVLVVGALILARLVEDRLVTDREHAAAAAVGTTIDQVQGGVPLGAITQSFEQGANIGIFDSTTGAPVGGITSPIKMITVHKDTGSTSGSIVLISGPPPQD